MGGRKPIRIDAIDWYRKMERMGAGVILPTRKDLDGPFGQEALIIV